MAYLHCKKQGCGWKQDEFWSEAYSPLHGGYFDQARKLLLEHLNRPPVQRYVEAPIDWAEENGLPYTECGGKARILTNEYLAWEMDKRAGLFRSQVHWTEKDFQTAPRCCPQCGSDQLSTEEEQIAAEETGSDHEGEQVAARPKKKAPRKKAAPKKKTAKKKAAKKTAKRKSPKKKAVKKAATKKKTSETVTVATIRPAKEIEESLVPDTPLKQSLKALPAEERQRRLQRRVGI